MEGGDDIVDSIVAMVQAASDAGAMIIASRDYHPHDHCSFAHAGGHFPSHCVQGTSGSKFLPEIARALEGAMRRRAERKEGGPVLVAFKAMHEEVDSFGALPYAGEPFGQGRGAKAAEPARGVAEGGAVMGCAKAPWTGSLVLKQSALAAAEDENDGRDDDDAFDADAPPDVLAVLQDGVDRKLRTMQDVLDAHLCRDTGRVFVCGLALDFCVHDTCVNGKALGMPRVAMVLDAARAAHIPGVGTHGSGFLSDPAQVRQTLVGRGVELVAARDVLPKGWAMPAPGAARTSFPASLGPLGLTSAPRLNISVTPFAAVPAPGAELRRPRRGAPGYPSRASVR